MNIEYSSKHHYNSIAREFAIQFLYQSEVNKRTVFEQESFDSFLEYFQVPDYAKEFLFKLLKNTFENVNYIDTLISEDSKNWAFYRITIIDKSILRAAISELIFFDTPPKVVIDEAIELARKYSSEKSYKFVNGILDSVATKLKKFSPWT